MELLLELTLLEAGMLLTEDEGMEDAMLLMALDDVMTVVWRFLKVTVVQPFAGTATMPLNGVTSCVIQPLSIVSLTV